MSGAINQPASETWCIVTSVSENGIGTVKSTHAGEHGYDEAISALQHPDELWLLFDAPPVGAHIVRRDRRST